MFPLSLFDFLMFSPILFTPQLPTNTSTVVVTVSGKGKVVAVVKVSVNF